MSCIFAKNTTNLVRSMLAEGNFEPVDNYVENECKYRIKWQTFECSSDTFVKVIVAERALQGLVQRYDGVEKKIKQAKSAPKYKKKVQQWEEEIQDLQQEIRLKQHELCINESFLPYWPFKQMYDSERFQRGIAA